MALTKIDDRGLKTPIDLLDNEKIRLGTGNDLQLFHDGSDSYINSRTGNLYLAPTTGTENGVTVVPNGEIRLYYDNSKKFETTSWGVEVTGTVKPDQLDLDDTHKIRIGNSADLQLYHDGNHSYLGNDTGWMHLFSDNFAIKDKSGGDAMIYCLHDGAVELYYDNVKKFETTTKGIGVIDNDSTVEIALTDSGGAAGHIYGKQSDGLISILVGNGEHAVNAYQNGAVELYYDNVRKLETFSSGVQLDDNLVIKDSKKANFGDGYDLQIYHNNSVNYIQTHNNSNLEFKAGSDYMASFKANTSVDLYYDNSKKFETTSTGINITGGIRLGGNNAANEMDDYEEGSWTPEIRKGDTTSNGTATVVNGKYVRVGKLLWLQAYYYKSSGSNTATGSWKIFGLPYSIAKLNDSSYQSAGEGYFGMNGTNQFDQGLNWRWQANHNDKLTMYGSLNSTNWDSGGFEISFGGCFLID